MTLKKKLSIGEKILYTVNLFFALVLLISYGLPYLSPEKIARLATLSLLFPILYSINILFVIVWIIKLKRQFILSFLILIVGYNHFNALFRISSKEILKNDDIKIMSYNVKTLNYYKWNEDDSLAIKTVNFIHSKSPEILLLQEFYNYENLHFDYPFNYVKMKSKTHKFGLAIFSKYPIVNSGSLDFKNSANNIIYADMIIKNDTVRVYNIHLESLKLNPKKENFGEADSKKLLGRLAQTFKKQAEQVTQFYQHEKKWKGKTIVSGDFNNTAFSWVYKTIKGDKTDAFVTAGKGFGKTFDHVFPIRIDFILTDSFFETNYYTSYNVKFSDHYPIFARLQKK